MRVFKQLVGVAGCVQVGPDQMASGSNVTLQPVDSSGTTRV